MPEIQMISPYFILHEHFCKFSGWMYPSTLTKIHIIFNNSMLEFLKRVNFLIKFSGEEGRKVFKE